MRKDVIICDLDGTLADLTHRRPLVERPHMVHDDGSTSVDIDWRPNWDGFHKACVDDTPLRTNIQVVVTLAETLGCELWIVSGRSQSVEAETREWIHKYVGPINGLLMRTVGDYTPDDRLKRQWILDGHMMPSKDRVLCVFDDRDRVVKMWRQLGLTCYQVAQGNF
jgi:hypothetical protein